MRTGAGVGIGVDIGTLDADEVDEAAFAAIAAVRDEIGRLRNAAECARAAVVWLRVVLESVVAALEPSDAFACPAVLFVSKWSRSDCNKFTGTVCSRKWSR